MSSPPVDPNFQSPSLHRLRRLVFAHGIPWSTALITLLAVVFSMTLTQGLITLIGHGNRWIAGGATLLSVLTITPPVCIAGLRLVFALEQACRRLDELATRDVLTGLFNRRHFMNLVEAEWDRARRYRTTAALLLIDVDHFKLVNDTHGHLCGDELLRRIAAAAGESLRQADVLARWGGEEFVVYLPHTDPLGAIDVAERIRERVKGLVLDWKGSPVATSVSIGVAPLRLELASLDWLLHEADTALYAAKADGRNCVRSLPFPAALNEGMVSDAPR
jgi:diguanylate cyclase (GGDEF)-like protein